MLKILDKDQVGSVSIAEMLYRTNLIAIISGGNHPIVSPNSGKYNLTLTWSSIKLNMPFFLVLIWDDKTKEFITEYTFKSKVYAVKLSHKK